MTVSAENLVFLVIGVVTGIVLGIFIHAVIYGRRRSREHLRDQERRIKETLDKYEETLNASERRRQKEYGSLSQRLADMAQTQQALSKETGNLSKALRVPHVRGRWGELTLKRAVEIAGMAEHCDFEVQVNSENADSALRPDMVIRLPGGRTIVVDAKVGLDAYLNALEAGSEQERKACMDRHAGQIVKHITSLSSKQYYKQFANTPEFVVLFIPGENFFSAAVESRPDLIETGVHKGVIPATPTTLIALLKSVAYSWTQEKGRENAAELRKLGVELYERLCSMTDNINRLGRDIERCVKTFNTTVGSVENRVLVSARKFHSLGGAGKTMNDPQSVDPNADPIRTMKQEKKVPGETEE
ncbi:MAG: DNA recombination protein RmuC [Thermodesulfobacteriota bacterium]